MCRNNPSHKSFESKILPASDCGSKIFARFPATAMIPIDQGGGGYTLKTNKNPLRACLPAQTVQEYVPAEIHSLDLINAIHKSNTDASHRSC
jgi:hypothetical protein